MRQTLKLPQLIALTAATCTLYLTMVLGPLATLQDMGGAPPMDMRPLGYAPDEVALFLNAMGQSGRDLYLMRQIPLDMIYPALLALTLAGWLVWLGRRGIWIAVVAALFDYAENLLIIAMIWGFPDTPDGIARAASLATVLKSGLSTLSFVWVLWAAGASVFRNRGPRRVRPPQKTASGR